MIRTGYKILFSSNVWQAYNSERQHSTDYLLSYYPNIFSFLASQIICADYFPAFFPRSYPAPDFC